MPKPHTKPKLTPAQLAAKHRRDERWRNRVNDGKRKEVKDKRRGKTEDRLRRKSVWMFDSEMDFLEDSTTLKFDTDAPVTDEEWDGFLIRHAALAEFRKLRKK